MGGRRIPIEDLVAECGKPQISFTMKEKRGLSTGYSSGDFLLEDLLKQMRAR
jgi:hypothetical protein